MRSPFRPSRQSIQGAGGYWGSLVQPALSRDQHRPTDPAALHISEAAVRELIQPDRCDTAKPSTPDSEVSQR